MTPCRPSTILEWLVLGYVVLIPIGGGPLPANMEWADLALVGICAALAAGRRRVALALHPLDVLVMVYLAGSVLSFRRSPDLVHSGLELAKQGSLAVVYLAFSLLARRREMVVNIACWFAWAAAALAATGLLALGVYLVTGREVGPFLSVAPIPAAGHVARITGTLLSPGFFCNYLTVALPFLLLLPRGPAHAHATGWWRAGPLVVVLAAMGTLTASIAGFLAGGLTAVWPRWGARRGLRLARVGLATLAGATLVGVNLMVMVTVRDVSWAADRNPRVPAPGHHYALQEEGAGAQRLTVSVSYNPMSYFLLKRVAVRALWREPLTGAGLGAFHAETERAYREGLLHAPYRRADPHAELLGRLAETGVVGGVTLLLLWWGIARYGWTLLRGEPAFAWASSAILAGLVGVLVNSLNADIMNFRFVWMGVGLLRGLLDRSG